MICVQSLRSHIHYPEVNTTDLDSLLCYNLTGVKHPRFPSMSLHFAGIDGDDNVEFPLARRNMFIPASIDAFGAIAAGALGYGAY